ncbi:hypothetical protein B0T10DRAFT_550779 [Thelonectria olida]|uniref:Uncharacterized protein n=1 Tax=Thelonectria olida TaxID=1576542 RepID=A0A9P8VY39_9HYPO|nr:hypothetical protein B0T10DRAFT_550779 [Thelonectria olida]
MLLVKTFAAFAALAACGVHAGPCLASTSTTSTSITSTSTTSTTTTTTTSASATPTCDYNIVQNHGFYGDDVTGASGVSFAHWSNTGNTGFGRLGTDLGGKDDPYSLRFYAPSGAGTVGASQVLNTQVNKLYSFSAWYYVESYSPSSTLTCTFSNSEASVVRINLATAEQQVWKQITGSAGVGTTAMTLDCEFSSDGAASILLDDFSFITACPVTTAP